MVEIEVNGLVEVLRCRIDPSLLAQQDRELLEELVASAVNQAIGKAKQLHADTVQSLTGGINLPGLEQAIGQVPPRQRRGADSRDLKHEVKRAGTHRIGQSLDPGVQQTAGHRQEVGRADGLHICCGSRRRRRWRWPMRFAA